MDLIRELEKKHKRLFYIMEKTEQLKKDMNDLFKDITELYGDSIELINKQKQQADR